MAKNQSYDEWITSRLKTTRPAIGLSFFWIVDACAEPGFLELIKNTSETEVWPLYMNTYLDEVRDAGPWFIRHNEESDLIHKLISLMKQAPMGFGVSVINKDEELLFDHFQNILECKMPEGGDGVFRFYDPRILYGIHSFPDQRFMRLVCGPALEVYFWEPGRSLPLAFKAVSDGYERLTAPPHLTQELIDHLWRESQVHTVISTLGGDYGKQLREMDLSSSYAFIDEVRKSLNGTRPISNRELAFATVQAIEKSTEATSWRH